MFVLAAWRAGCCDAFFYEFGNGDPTRSVEVVSSTVVKVVIPDFLAFVVSVREGGVIGRTAVIGLRAVTLPAFSIVIPCPVALLAAITLSALIVGLRALVEKRGPTHSHIRRTASCRAAVKRGRIPGVAKMTSSASWQLCWRKWVRANGSFAVSIQNGRGMPSLQLPPPCPRASVRAPIPPLSQNTDGTTFSEHRGSRRGGLRSVCAQWGRLVRWRARV